MQSDIHQILASNVRAHLQNRLDAPRGAFDDTCTQVSYLRDTHLVRSLDDKPRHMDSENALSVKLLRQALKWSYKVRAESSEVQNEEAIIGFERRSRDAADWRLPFSERSGWPESRLARVFLLAQQLARHASASYSIGRPSHGPGTTFFRYSTLLTKYAWLERDVPGAVWRRFSEFFVPSPSSDRILPFENFGRNICRVALVPKDARGPRLVAPHMASAVWVQQAILDGISNTVLTHPIFAGYWPEGGPVQTVQLRDQSINQKVAKYASENPTMYATIDLKDASDLISWRLVCFLLKGTILLKDLYAVRATHCELPDKRVIPLGMHAPMGSAVCFPIMALCLWSLCTAAGWLVDHEYARYRPTSKSLWSENKPFVFGDDIIIPIRHYNAVKTTLEHAGLRLNANKTFYGLGGFRESCGHDYYRGHLITPTTLRRVDVSSLEGFVSMVSLHNRLAAEGQTIVSDTILELLLEKNQHHDCAARLAFSSDLHTPAIHVDSVRTACRLNRAIGNCVRYNVGLQRMEVLTRTLIREEDVCGNQQLDSRDRLYESLASHHKRDVNLASGVGDEATSTSFGWSSNRPRARNVWIAC